MLINLLKLVSQEEFKLGIELQFLNLFIDIGSFVNLYLQVVFEFVYRYRQIFFINIEFYNR